MPHLDHALAYAALGIPVMPLFESNSHQGVQLRASGPRHRTRRVEHATAECRWVLRR